MFFVGSFVGEQIKSLQNRLKECRTSPTTNDDNGPEGAILENKAYYDASNSTSLGVDHSARDEEKEVATDVV